MKFKFYGRRKVKVTLTRNQWNYRMNGLIQYLSNFCQKIEWEISDEKTQPEEVQKR